MSLRKRLGILVGLHTCTFTHTQHTNRHTPTLKFASTMSEIRTLDTEYPLKLYFPLKHEEALKI